MSSENFHIPVLSHEAVKLLINEELPEQILVDGTLGGGGYTRLICENTKDHDRIISIDKDLNALEYAGKNLTLYKDKIIFVNGNFGDIKNIINELNIKKITGIVLDLGLSSYQLEAEDGFSFMKNTALDMRAYKKDGITAGEILNSYDKADLISLFEKYGEIGNAERLVTAIINKRRIKKFETTFDLTDTITEEYDLNRKNQIDFLAKIFQALRIEVNNEMQNLENVLSHSIELIEKGGRIVIVSYHSLEDRIVKNFFKEGSSDKLISDSPYGYENKIPLLKMLTKKPVEPTFEEIKFNSRSRSAKLRAAEII